MYPMPVAPFSVQKSLEVETFVGRKLHLNNNRQRFNSVLAQGEGVGVDPESLPAAFGPIRLAAYNVPSYLMR